MSPGVRSAWFALLFPAFFIHPTAFSTRAVELSGACRTGRKVGKRSMASHFPWHRREGLVCFNAPARLLLRSHFSANCFRIRKALLLKLSCCSYHSDLSRSHCLENSEQTSEYAKQPNTTRRKNVWIHIWHWATVFTAMDKAPLRQGCLVSKRKRCNISEKIEKKKRKLSVRDLSQNRKVDGIRGQAQTCRSPAKFRDTRTDQQTEKRPTNVRSAFLRWQQPHRNNNTYDFLLFWCLQRDPYCMPYANCRVAGNDDLRTACTETNDCDGQPS